MKSKFYRINIYVSTLLVYITFIATIGIISRIKKPMSDRLQLSESFLGILDSLTFVGGLLGALSMLLYKFKRLVLTVSCFAFFMMSAMEISILVDFFPSFVQPILIFSRLLYGFFRVYEVMIFVIVNQTFTDRNQQKYIQIWYGLGIIGDLIGIAVIEYLMVSWSCNWKIALTISLGLSCFCVIYMLTVVPEKEQQQTCKEKEKQNRVKNMINFIRGYWGKGINIMQSLTYACSSIYYLMLLWLPYYFTTLGFTKESSFIASAYPFAYLASGFLFQPIQEFFKSFLGLTFLIILILNAGISILLNTLTDDPADIPQYIVYIVITSFLTSGYSIFAQTTDVRNRVRNPKDLLQVNSLNRFLSIIVYTIESLVSGVLVQKDVKNLFRLYSGILIMIVLVHFVRLMMFPGSFQQAEDETEIGIDEEI